MRNRTICAAFLAASFAAAALTLTSCGRTSSRSSGVNYMAEDTAVGRSNAMMRSDPAESYDMSEGSYNSGNDSAITEDRKLIRTVSVSVRIPSDDGLSDAVAEISSKARQCGGYVTGNDVSYERNYAGGTLNLQIPAYKVDAFLDFLKGGSHTVTGINDSTRDVTADYVDTEARIKVKEQEIANYQKYLESAENVTETLEISDRLNQSIADLEAQKARMNAMNRKIEYTEVTVSISCDTAVHKQSLGEKVSEALGDIGETFVDSLLDGLEWFTEAVAHLVFILPIIWVVLRVIASALGRRRRKDTEKKPSFLKNMLNRQQVGTAEAAAEAGSEDKEKSGTASGGA